MTYISPWERLSAAIEHVMAAAGLSKDDAQSLICRAIADRAVKTRCTLRKHLTRPIRAPKNTVLEREDFDIPPELKPEDLDWEQSRPRKAWFVRRENPRLTG
jgi:hypothetical protein